MLRSFHKLYAYAKKNKRLEDFWILCGPTENIQALWADVEDGGTESGSGEDGDSNRDANDKVITPTNVLEDDLDPGTSLLWRAETHNFLVGTVRLERRVRVLSEDLTISDVEEPSRKRVKTAEDPWAKYDEIPGNGKGRDELEEVGSVSRKPAEFDGLGHGAFDKTGNDNDDSIMINSAGEADDASEEADWGAPMIMKRLVGSMTMIMRMVVVGSTTILRMTGTVTLITRMTVRMVLMMSIMVQAFKRRVKESDGGHAAAPSR